MPKARIHKSNAKQSKSSGLKPQERQTDQEMLNCQCVTVEVSLFGGARNIQTILAAAGGTDQPRSRMEH